MSLKDQVEAHSVYFFFGGVFAAFIAGWVGHSTLQKLSGLVVIASDKLSMLEERASLGKEDIEKENQLLRGKVTWLEKEVDRVSKRVFKNSAQNGNHVFNVEIKPFAEGNLEVGRKLYVDFDYQIQDGVDATIYVTSGDLTYQSSGLISGNGRAKRYILSKRPTQVEEVLVTIFDNETGDNIHQVSFPVNIVYTSP